MATNNEHLQHAVLAALRKHIGRNNGTTARDLVDELRGAGETLSERDLRMVVVDLRLQGHHVCAHPSAGYFLAANEQELEDTVEFLRQRALRSLEQIAAMNRVSLPDLMGQMRLPS